MSVTEEIKSRIDIVSYVQRHVPELKKAGRNHKACCPFHTEKTPSFIVNPERQSWHCFGACAEGGDLFTFAQKMHGWDFKEALQELALEAGVELRQRTPEQQARTDRLDRMRGLVTAAADLYHEQLFKPEASPILDYAVKSRGLSRETVGNFRIGVAPDRWDFTLQALLAMGYDEDEIIEAGLAVRNERGRIYDRFRNRLIIPINDERRRTVGFGGRALDPDEPAKYINSPQSPLFDKSRLLYGLDRARSAIRETGLAVIVEGYTDVIQAHQAGYLNVVAQMGTAMTEAQIRRIAPRYAKSIVLALDSDAAGQSAARRSLEVARQTLAADYAGKLQVDIRVLQLPSGQDPDDVLRHSPQTWPQLVESAQDVADFVIDSETASLPPNASMAARQQAALNILPILSATENNPYQRENLQKLARRLRISERDLLAWAPARSNSPKAPKPSQLQIRGLDYAAQNLDDVPPEYWDSEYEPAPPDIDNGQGPSSVYPSEQQRAIEPYCLSLLLKNPNLLYKVNRKLRELAGADSSLRHGPLGDLNENDFTHSQYRILMTYLLEAMTQDDQEPLDYLVSVVEGELSADLRALLSDDAQQVSSRMQGAFLVDLSDIIERRRSRGALANEVSDMLIGRALQLRLQRLERERIEMQYLQEEAQTGADIDQQHRERLSQQIMLSMTAKARLDHEVRYA